MTSSTPSQQPLKNYGERVLRWLNRYVWVFFILAALVFGWAAYAALEQGRRDGLRDRQLDQVKKRAGNP